MKISVILPAAGFGNRFADGQIANARRKIELDLAGKPVFLRAVELFINRDNVEQVILAVPPDTLDTFKLRWGDKIGFLGVVVVSGGAAGRWETVLRALDAVDESCTHVAIHDAVRPLTSPAMIDRVFAVAERFDAVIPAVAVPGTLKRVEQEPGSTQATAPDPLDGILSGAGKPKVARVIETVDREGVVEAQTPQVFEIGLLRRAYHRIAGSGIQQSSITDDASLVESLGQTVRVVEGETTNLKITHPADADLAAAIIENRQAATARELGEKRLFVDDD